MHTGLVTSTVFLKTKDFWRSQAVTYTAIRDVNESPET